METSDPLTLTVTEASHVAEARRQVATLARGFHEAEGGKVPLIVTEICTNLIKHGGGGQLLARRRRHGAAVGVELLALDRGPGMADVEKCLRDGHSTAGSLGLGLGTIARLSASLDVYSLPGKGTALLARVWSGRVPPPDSLPEQGIGAVSVPKDGQEVCGDGWAVRHTPEATFLLVVDGLGYGPQASWASAEAIRIFREATLDSPAALLAPMHPALKDTRGAVAAVAAVRPAAGTVTFAGVGNIAGAVVSGEGNRHLLSHDGALGYQVSRLREYSYPWPAGATLVLHTDGIGTRWSMAAYPGLARRDPVLVAGVLYRDFRRNNDDATVVVVKGGTP